MAALYSWKTQNLCCCLRTPGDAAACVHLPDWSAIESGIGNAVSRSRSGGTCCHERWHNVWPARLAKMSWLRLNEVRHGFRILRKSPAWAAVMGSMLALGIGLATVIFG